MLKIKLHSQVDLITNSSTTIYTYSRGSVDAFKNVVNEMLSLFGQNKTCDDVFSIVVACDCDDYVTWKRKENKKLDRDERKKLADQIEDIFKDVIHAKIEKPDWFTTVEEEENDFGYIPQTYLYISPKSAEFENLGSLLTTFLYSTSHEGFRDG
jgi:hypothetical protein